MIVVMMMTYRAQNEVAALQEEAANLRLQQEAETTALATARSALHAAQLQVKQKIINALWNSNYSNYTG